MSNGLGWRGISTLCFVYGKIVVSWVWVVNYKSLLCVEENKLKPSRDKDD